jgi:Zn-dependent protease with chaperone function
MVLRWRNLNATGPGFKACLFHPSLGNEVVAGRLLVDRFSLRFQSDSFNEEIPASRIMVDWNEGDEKIYFKDSARPELSIYTLDQSILKHPALPQLDEIRAEIGGARGRAELSRRLRITLYFFAGCVLVAGLFSWATGAMVRSLAAKVPAEWEQQFGEARIERMRGEMSLENYSNQVVQLTALAAPLLRVVPHGSTEVKFYIVEDPTPNAFALPGGHVVVNTGLLELTERPEELLGVLAHELAHVTQKHLVRKMISASGPILIFGFFLHSRDSLLNVISQGSGLMVYQSFSKEFETEADDVGWQYLAAASIDPRGMITMFRKLKAYEDNQKLHLAMPRAFQSHPALEKRISRLESKWKKLSHKDGFIEVTNQIPSVGQSDSIVNPAVKKR